MNIFAEVSNAAANKLAAAKKTEQVATRLSDFLVLGASILADLRIPSVDEAVSFPHPDEEPAGYQRPADFPATFEMKSSEEIADDTMLESINDYKETRRASENINRSTRVLVLFAVAANRLDAESALRFKEVIFLAAGVDQGMFNFDNVFARLEFALRLRDPVAISQIFNWFRGQYIQPILSKTTAAERMQAFIDAEALYCDTPSAVVFENMLSYYTRQESLDPKYDVVLGNTGVSLELDACASAATFAFPEGLDKALTAGSETIVVQIDKAPVCSTSTATPPGFKLVDCYSGMGQVCVIDGEESQEVRPEHVIDPLLAPAEEVPVVSTAVFVMPTDAELDAVLDGAPNTTFSLPEPATVPSIDMDAQAITGAQEGVAKPPAK